MHPSEIEGAFVGRFNSVYQMSWLARSLAGVYMFIPFSIFGTEEPGPVDLKIAFAPH